MTFIAEIGSGHEGSLTKAKELIDAAKESGAHTVKFQWIIAEEIVSKNIGSMHFTVADADLYQTFRECEKNLDFYQELSDHARSRKVSFLCSVFGLESLSLYQKLNPDSIKLASPEINHVPLLEKIAQSNLKVYVSTGLASCIDILSCLQTLHPAPCIGILHCVTEYPAQYSQYNLDSLPCYQNLFGTDCGISDHSNTKALLPAASVLYGSRIVEKHFALEKNLNLDSPVSLMPKDFTDMVNETKTMIELQKRDRAQALRYLQELQEREDATGSKIPASRWESPPLRDIYHSSRRSLFTNTNIEKASPIQKTAVKVLRSEKNLRPGIPAEFLCYSRLFPEKIRTKHSISAEKSLQLHDIEHNLLLIDHSLHVKSKKESILYSKILEKRWQKMYTIL